MKKTGILIPRVVFLKTISSGHKRMPDIILKAVTAHLPSRNYFAKGYSQYKSSRQSHSSISHQEHDFHRTSTSNCFRKFADDS